MLIILGGFFGNEDFNVNSEIHSYFIFWKKREGEKKHSENKISDDVLKKDFLCGGIT